MSFEDQINLFKNATDVVGLHGAGFANIIFCKSNTKIIELKPIHAGKVIANLANNNDLDYRDISIEPSKHSHNNQQGLINVPINLLEKKIS